MEDLAQRLSARGAWCESPKAAKHREAAEHQRHSDSAECQASERQSGGVAEHQSGRRLERPKSGVAEDRSNRGLERPKIGAMREGAERRAPEWRSSGLAKHRRNRALEWP